MDGGLWLHLSCEYFINSRRQFQRCLLVSYPASRVSSIFLDQSGRGTDSASAFDISYWACSKLKCNRASPSLTLRTKFGSSCEVSRQVSASISIHMAFTPCSSIENLRSVYSSPKTPIKKSVYKIRSKAKDTICLVCAISLIGERCTFNIEQHNGLRQKLESVLEHDINFKASSSRICRPCGRKVEALEKSSVWSWNKSRSFWENLCRLVGRISLTLWSECRKPVLRPKLTKNLARAGCLYRLRKTIAKKMILQKAFNSCPTMTVWNAASHPN